MKDQTKVCWSCGSRNMSPVETWYKCDDCGATTDDVHQPGSSTVTFEPGKDQTGEIKSFIAHNRPSGVVMSRATRARKESQERAEALAKRKG